MKRDFMDMWNDGSYRRYRAGVNAAGKNGRAVRCYQSSHANWNRREAFLQMGEQFRLTLAEGLKHSGGNDLKQ